jgi:cob(I)alamin adenosyltransferase
MRITKVYTRTGDAGRTRLAGGSEISKADLRIEAYGTIDELNAIIGIIRTMAGQAQASTVVLKRLDAMLHEVQNRLFDVGGELATPPEALHPSQGLVREEDVKVLEDWIDSLNEELGPLTEFTLPGGGPVGAFFHQARTVCRRAERRVIAMVNADPESLREGSLVIPIVNRLSDWLFVAGRWAAMTCSEPEYLWERR